MFQKQAITESIVDTYLKCLSEVSGIRREKISLDQKLYTDLGLNRVEIHSVLARASEALGIDMYLEDGGVSEGTSREMIALLVHWSRWSYSHPEAA